MKVLICRMRRLGEIEFVVKHENTQLCILRNHRNFEELFRGTVVCPMIQYEIHIMNNNMRITSNVIRNTPGSGCVR